jgi:glycosyl-4,4'-diaponeurosporenoate acyltransferase
VRLIFFPAPVTALLDVAAWLVIQFGAAKLATSMDARRFKPGGWLFRARGWERDGSFYEIVGIRRWKDSLPDAGPWFAGGFSKAGLASRAPDYLQRFIVETCRGEGAHWLAMFPAPLFFFWNRPWVGGLMVAYALVGNLPCLIAQRYNRRRLERLLKLL